MKDEKKTKEQLINELVELHKRIAELEKSEKQPEQIEEALSQSEERYRRLIETMPDVLYSFSVETGIITSLNPAFEKITGWSISEWLGRPFMSIIHPNDLPFAMEVVQNICRGETLPPYELRILSKTGEYLVGEFTSALEIKNGKVERIHGISRDITEHKQAEDALQKSEERYRTIFEDSRDAIYITTRDGIFVEVNQSLLNLFGYIREEMIGMNALQIYVNPDDRSTFQQDIEQTGFVRNYKIKFRKKDGTEMDCLLTTTVRKTVDGTVLGYQGIIRDVTELKKVEDQLRYLSLHDPLTGLYNRAYFEEEMHRVESGRYDSAGIIMCDVDGLKLVNDALGHYAGDNLLLATANILKESFREGDVAARVGGDEFAVLLPNSDSNAIEIARLRIQDAVERHNSSNPPLPLSISIGSAIGTGSSIIMTNLFKEADNNMYREKLQHSLSTRSTIVQNFMKALETEEAVAELRRRAGTKFDPDLVTKFIEVLDNIKE